MTIPFNNLLPALSEIRLSIDKAIQRVMDSGVFIGGDEVAAFEEEWAKYCGADYCVACASGTDALMLAANSFGFDNLTVPANSCEFTATGVKRFCDYVYYQDADERGYSSKVMNFVNVLLYGRQWHQDEWRHSIFDGCQAHGWKPPKGAIVAWSGYPTKNLGGFGDCGWLTTDDADAEEEARFVSREWHSRMSEINAAVLRTKLPHLDRWNSERAAIAEVYYNELPDWCEPACRHGEPTNHHIFAILVDRRDELESHLLVNGIGTKVHYREPLADLPGAKRFCSRTLSLPMWPGLTPQQVQTVCDTIRSFR